MKTIEKLSGHEFARTEWRRGLLCLVDELGITDEEAGEPQWQAYLTDGQLADAIRELRPAAAIPADPAEAAR